MGIGGVGVPVIVPVVMAVIVGMVVVVMVVMPQGDGDAVGLAGPGALELTEGAALDQPLDVVVVALLRGTHLGLKTEHLGTVLTERAVHLGLAAHDLLDPLFEGVDHQGVIP